MFLTDHNGETGEKVESGSAVGLNCIYSSSIESDNCAFAYGITDLHGTVLWGTNSKVQGVPFPVEKGIGSNSIAIADGSYVQEFDHWSRRHRFRVHQNSVRELGMVEMDSHWVT